MSDKESLSKRASRISNYTETSVESAKKYITKGIIDEAERRYHRYQLRPLYHWVDTSNNTSRFIQLQPDEMERIIDWLIEEGFTVSEGRSYWNVTWK